MVKVIEKCGVCGKDFVAYTRRLKLNSRTGKHFCSRDCWNFYRVQRLAIKCVICGEMFHVKPSRANRITTCSPACRTLRVGSDNHDRRVDETSGI